jgi:hypothetical protein
VIGFDLEGHDTTSSDDPVGCGQIDQSGGVDNALAQLLNLLADLAPEELAFNEKIAAAIAGGSISLAVEMKGYDGPNDEFVVLSLSSGGKPVAGAQGLCVASNRDGSVRVGFPSLSLTIPDAYVDGMNTYPLTIAMTDVLLEIADPWATTASAVIGGHVLWNDGMGGGLYPDVHAIFDALVGGIDLNAIVGSILDLGPDGACDSFSLGMRATLSPVIQ